MPKRRSEHKARPRQPGRVVQPRGALGPSAAAPLAHACVALVVEGLEEIARDELKRALDNGVRLSAPSDRQPEPGEVSFVYTGDLRALLGLQTVQAVYLTRRFPVPRPRGLLGDAHFRALLDLIARVRALHPPAAFTSLFISAAGSESSVMLRLKEAVSHATGLAVGAHEGDLHIRLRRWRADEGWEALVRLSPRPLATRPWRVCSLEGALNATVAHALALLTGPTPADVVLNVACGSGSLLIERLAAGPARRVLGCDTSAAALDCARANIAASGYSPTIELHSWDARALPLPAASIDALVADLPFGNLVGSHDENLALYPALLAEAARVARPGARFVLITHEVRLMERLLAGSADWSVAATLRVTLRGLHPRIYVLSRCAGGA